MKSIKFCLVFVLCIGAVCAVSDEDEWKNFKTKFNKTYENSEEEAKRLEIFKNNLEFIRKHDERENKFKVEVNRLADLNTNEFYDSKQPEVR